MTPDSVEARLNKLEREFSAFRAQLQDALSDLEKLDEARMAIVENRGHIKRLFEALKEVKQAIEAETIANRKAQALLQDSIEKMKNSQEAQARASKAQLWSAAVAIVTTLLVVGGGILGAIVGGN